MVRHAAFVRAMNDAWTLVAVLTLAAVLGLPFARIQRGREAPRLRC